METKQRRQQQQQQQQPLSWSTSMVLAPLRRRLLAGAGHIRSVLRQCFLPGSSDNNRSPKRRKSEIFQPCQPILPHKPSFDEGSKTILPISTSPSEENETATSSSLLLSPSSVKTEVLFSNDSTDESNVPVSQPQTTATAILERPPPSRRPRPFLVRHRRMSKLKPATTAASTEGASNKKPVTASGANSSFRPRFPGANRAPSSSSTPSTNGANSSNSTGPGRTPSFHGGSTSASGCVMTFVIFTNGSSTRMWFLVSRQPTRAARPPPSSSNRRSAFFSSRSNGNNNNNSNNINNSNGSASNGASSRRSSSSVLNGRRRVASTPPNLCSSEKKRSLINRFLCSEDGHCTGSDGRSRLAIAASWACPAAIKLLLRRGAPVNSVDSRGKAALHYVAYGHSSVEAVVECLLLLLDAGAIVNCFDDENNTPLHLAALAGCGPAMGLLLRRGADSSLPNATGRTPVFNFLNNAFNADNVPGLLELAGGSPYAFAGAFHLPRKMKNLSPQVNPTHLSTAALFDSSPSKKLLDCSGRMPLVLKLTLQPSLMPIHVDETLVLSSQFKELLCLFATCPPSLQLLSTYAIRSTILETLSEMKDKENGGMDCKTPSSANIKAAANVIDLPNSLKNFIFS